MLNSLNENISEGDQFHNLLCKGCACFDHPGLIDRVQFVVQNNFARQIAKNCRIIVLNRAKKQFCPMSVW